MNPIDLVVTTDKLNDLMPSFTQKRLFGGEHDVFTTWSCVEVMNNQYIHAYLRECLS